MNPNKTIDLSGRWNSTDVQQTADAMIEQVLNERWLEDFRTSHPTTKPVVVVEFVQNKTHEHIDSESFVQDIENKKYNLK